MGILRRRRTRLKRIAAGVAVASAIVAGPAAGEAAASTGAVPDKPRKGCDTPWCNKVRTTRAIALRIDRTMARRGSPLAGTGIWHARSGRRYNVSPFLVVAASGIESTFGEANCAPYNAWGMLAYCGSGFASWRHGIDYATRLLRDLGAHQGRSVYSIGAVYCPPCGSGWGAKAEYFQRAILHVAPSVTYTQAARAVGRKKLGAR